MLKAGLCSSGAWSPLAPNFCSRVTRKSQIFHTNHMLGTLDFTGSEHWAPLEHSLVKVKPFISYPVLTSLSN